MFTDQSLMSNIMLLEIIINTLELKWFKKAGIYIL
jgi:hypothetical protein